ncbi:MAG: SIS domain-containing protein, partial [Planctomycetota bacterium]
LRAMAIRLGHLGLEARCLGADGRGGIQSGDLVVVGSGSGRTPVPLDQARAAHEAGAPLVAITADPASPIADLADHVIHIPARVTPTNGTPHTLRSLFEESLLVVCDCVCRLLADRLGASADDMQARHAPDQ